MQETETKREKGTGRSNLWFLLINVVVIAAIAIREFGGGARPERIAMREINPLFLLAALGCFLVMLFSETWKYARLLMETGHARPLHTGFRCAVLGKYFDNITPAGFGGQPFQIHYLKTHGCSDGVAGSLPILGFLGLQFTFIGIALAVFLFGSRVFSDFLTMRLAAWAGLLLYSFVPVCVVLFSIAPRPLMRVVDWGTRLLHRMRVVKDAEETSRRAIDALRSYTESVRYFSSQPRMLAVVVLMSLLFRLAMVSMPWFVLRAFGAHVGFLRCFCQVTYIYAVITLIPTPGNSGAAEASFYTVFSTLAHGNAFWAMLVWRLLCYYFWLLGGAAHYIAKARAERMPYRDLDPEEKPRCALITEGIYPGEDAAAATVSAYALRMDDAAVVCAGSGQARGEVLARVPALRLGKLSFLLALPFLCGRARQALQKGNYRVLHAHSPLLLGHFALRMGRRLGVPVVATFHKKHYDDLRALVRSDWLRRALMGYVGRFYKQADQVWASGAAAVRSLRDCGYDGEIRMVERGPRERTEGERGPWDGIVLQAEDAYRQVIHAAALDPQPRD